MLIDTHCHLDFKDFDQDRDEVIKRAKDIGVTRILNVGSSLEGSIRAVELSKKYDIIYASVGIHPHDASAVTEESFSRIKELAKEDKVVAIGEVGLDYYRNLSPKQAQIDAFKKFIELALELDMPLIIHAREADKDVIDILTQYAKKNASKSIKGVMHCFSGDELFLKKCLNLGLHISFTCNLTYKNASGLREVAEKVPVDRLMIETDAPYLSPQNLRGKRNESSNLKFLVDELLKIFPDMTKSDLERITTHNANDIFKLGLETGAKITYEIRDSLYLNITNRCTNACDFCVRNTTSFIKGHNLTLEKEPTVEELLRTIGDPKRYKEIVFCGYGEPTIRLDVVKEVSKALKANGLRAVGHAPKIRLVTNGHGDIINSKPIDARR